MILNIIAGGWSQTMPVSSLPHPNLYLMNQFLGLASVGIDQSEASNEVT